MKKYNQIPSLVILAISWIILSLINYNIFIVNGSTTYQVLYIVLILNLVLLIMTYFYIKYLLLMTTLMKNHHIAAICGTRNQNNFRPSFTVLDPYTTEERKEIAKELNEKHRLHSHQTLTQKYIELP